MAYQDGAIGVTEDALTIKGYYFPGVVKRVPLAGIRSVRQVHMAALRGRGRIWGTANWGYWANFDPRRPRKAVAFLVDSGKSVKAFVTPDDPDAFGTALRERGAEITDGGSAPLI